MKIYLYSVLFLTLFIYYRDRAITLSKHFYIYSESCTCKPRYKTGQQDHRFKGMSHVNKNFAKILVREVLSDRYRRRQEKIPLPRSRNMYEVSAIYPLSTVISDRKLCKMLVRRVLSDRYRRRQEKFQYHGVEICMKFWLYTLYQQSLVIGSYVKRWCVGYYRID